MQDGTLISKIAFPFAVTALHSHLTHTVVGSATGECALIRHNVVELQSQESTAPYSGAPSSEALANSERRPDCMASFDLRFCDGAHNSATAVKRSTAEAAFEALAPEPALPPAEPRSKQPAAAAATPDDDTKAACEGTTGSTPDVDTVRS